jgi:hypothetical protein
MGFSIPPFRNVLTGDPAGVSDPKSSLGAVRFRAAPAEGSPLPVVPPDPATKRGLIEALGLMTGEGILGSWVFNDGSSGAPSYKDMAWRWRKHDALLNNNGHASIDSVGTLFTPASFEREIGGGAGPVLPVIAASGQNYYGDFIIDQRVTPVWSLIVEWESLGPVDNNGTWTSFSASMSSTPPNGPYAIPQPIVAWSYDNTWRLVLVHLTHWSGGPGAWVEDGTDALYFYANNYQAGFGPVIVNPSPSGGITLLEFDSTTNTISMYVYDSFSHEFILAGSTKVASVVPFAASGTTFGGGTNGPYYWTYYTHLNGYVMSSVIFPDSAEFTTDLLSKALLVPGTGPVTTAGVEFRAAPPSPDGSVSARLTEYAHYWPLDDPSPGPMTDLIAGVRLSVINPSQATFQVDGLSPTSTDGHVKGIHLGGTAAAFGSFVTARMDQISGASANLGAGGLGNDFTFAMRVKWEGPLGYSGSSSLIQSSGIPFSFVTEPGINIWIGTAVAEPIGVTFQTWNPAHSRFDTCSTSGFDWPAEYFRDGGGVPQKAAKWAFLTVVYRTVGAAIQMEIWVDGVLLATQSADPGGWGQNVHLFRVGNGYKGALQDLAFWPFALTAAEIAGL